jgi:hypothetical protein
MSFGGRSFDLVFEDQGQKIAAFGSSYRGVSFGAEHVGASLLAKRPEQSLRI